MFRPRVIPCLLLKDFGLVKTVNFENPTYIGDPINAVRIFNDFEADELVFLDINASNEGRCINFEFVKKVGEEAFMPFSVGGGIKNLEQIENDHQKVNGRLRQLNQNLVNVNEVYINKIVELERKVKDEQGSIKEKKAQRT